MKVLYDISVLGLGHIIPSGRTGVFRVIENLALQLPLHPECDVTFCSNTDLKMVGYSMAYLRDSMSLSKVPFSKPSFFYWRLNAKKDVLINLIMSKVPLSLVKKLMVKLEIKEYVAIEKMYKFYNNSLINKKDQRDADIYHSPFYALPQQVYKGSYKSVFLTCYDLIPILFPHYFEQNIIDMMKDIINSITPETWVLCISEATRADLLNHLGNKVSAERVIVTELAASDTFYQSTDSLKNRLVRQKHNIPEMSYVLSLCTFEPRKNIDQVIKAFSRMITEENIKDLHLVLVGIKGWMFDKIFAEIVSSEEVKNRITITGFVADEDLAAIYSDALFFVYPSFYEGFGLPPLEAMQCGVPVITSNTSSLPEVVGDAGIMVSPTDLNELCQAMLSVYKSPSLRSKMVEQSLHRATKFSWQRCADETVSAYRTSLIL